MQQLKNTAVALTNTNSRKKSQEENKKRTEQN